MPSSSASPEPDCDRCRQSELDSARSIINLVLPRGLPKMLAMSSTPIVVNPNLNLNLSLNPVAANAAGSSSRAVSASLVGSPVSATLPVECDECVPVPVSAVACEVADCQDHITEACTDECVVVACDDPSHDPSPLHDLSCTRPGPGDCPQPFQCCAKYNRYHTEPLTTAKELDQLLCHCGGIRPNPAHTADMSWPPSDYYDHQQHDHHQHQQHNPGSLSHFSDEEVSQALGMHIHSNSIENPVQHHQFPPLHPSAYPPLAPLNYGHAPPPLPMSASAGHRCMWGECGRMFEEFSALVGHVIVDHLRRPDPSSNGSIMPTPSATPLLGTIDECGMHGHRLHAHPDHMAMNFVHPPGAAIHNAFPSMWPQDMSTSMSLDGHSMESIHSHSSSTASSSPSLRTPPMASSNGIQPMFDVTTPTSFNTGLSSSTFPEATSSSHSHLCQWAGCALSFSTTATLDAHVDETHIGSGKAHYDCYWGDCGRNDTQGFASRQKIKRHVQSHTGHRPHTCEVCGQSFSEAATLQQHLRRHKSEKPYKCDVPGCGKAFTVAGALTIHKRTHSGHKPFQCPHCEKAFAESSNLSKHMRTHTGARPYECEICAKKFARPDQLNRHVAGVHKKMELGTPALEEDEGSAMQL